MINIRVLDDGSAVKIWTAKDGSVTLTSSYSPEAFEALRNQSCCNTPDGCGTCLTCVMAAAWEESWQGICGESAKGAWRALTNMEDRECR